MTNLKRTNFVEFIFLELVPKGFLFVVEKSEKILFFAKEDSFFVLLFSSFGKTSLGNINLKEHF